MNYDIAEGKTIQDLRQQVNNAIAKGWKPIGGICTAYIPVHFYQTMTKDSQ